MEADGLRIQLGVQVLESILQVHWPDAIEHGALLSENTISCNITFRSKVRSLSSPNFRVLHTVRQWRGLHESSMMEPCEPL